MSETNGAEKSHTIACKQAIVMYHRYINYSKLIHPTKKDGFHRLYFPIQKFEKILSKMFSEIFSPIISPSTS